MKLFLRCTILLSLHVCLIHGQYNAFKDGAYRNSNDFFKNNPVFEPECRFELIYNKKIPDLYRVRFSNPKIKSKISSNAIWGIKDGNYFYINAKRIGLANGYIKIKNPTVYSYFKGPLLTINQKSELSNAYYQFGAIGGVVKEINMKKGNKDKVHYVLNFNSGMVNLLTPGYLCMLMEKDKVLLEEFKKEPDHHSIEVLLKYLNLINSKTGPLHYLTKTNFPSPDSPSL